MADCSKPQPLNVELGKAEADALFRRRDRNELIRQRTTDSDDRTEDERWCDEHLWDFLEEAES